MRIADFFIPSVTCKKRKQDHTPPTSTRKYEKLSCPYCSKTCDGNAALQNHKISKHSREMNAQQPTLYEYSTARTAHIQEMVKLTVQSLVYRVECMYTGVPGMPWMLEPWKYCASAMYVVLRESRTELEHYNTHPTLLKIRKAEAEKKRKATAEATNKRGKKGNKKAKGASKRTALTFGRKKDLLDDIRYVYVYKKTQELSQLPYKIKDEL